MKLAMVAVEDRRFYEHRAVDLRGIFRAIYADVVQKRVVQGGSTITQQFIKNTYLRDQRSIGRKLKEATLAWQLEQRWSKDKILTAYLNTIYFGNSAYGIQRAAQTYFGHGASKLTLAESALLAGIPSDPTLYDPVTNPREARARRAIVLRDLLDQGYITKRQYVVALRVPLPRAEDVHLPGDQGPAQYFTNYVKQQLVDKYGSGRVFGGGLRVHTTIDLGLQTIARDAISKVLTDPGGPSAALVAIDPKTGAVLAMVGGKNYRTSQFNLAVQGERQPGSSFKPFVLATALEDGISPQSTFVSQPTTILAGGPALDGAQLRALLPGADQPRDGDDGVGQHGVRAAHAARRSARPSRGRRSGSGSRARCRPYYAIGLGAEAVNPLEMARAYSAFANGGYRIDGNAFGDTPRAITTVENAKAPARQRQPAGAPAEAPAEHGRDHRPAAGQRDQSGNGPEGPARRRTAGGRQDRHDRELRRRLVRRLHAQPRGGDLGRLSEQARPDGDAVRRPSRRRRHLPGADLEDLHGARAAVSAQAAGLVPLTALPVRVPVQGRVARRQDAARQRVLPQRGLGAPVLRDGAAQDGALQAERGVRSARRRLHDPRGARQARRPTTDGHVRLQACAPAAAARHRRRAVPEQGHPLLLRRRDARLAEGDARRYPTRGRAALCARPRGRSSGGSSGSTSRSATGAPGRILSQLPTPGVAAAPGITVRVVVGRR